MNTRTLTAGLVAATCATVLTACSAQDSDSNATSQAPAEQTVTTAMTTTASAGTQPTATELNAVLARATDPNVPLEQKVETVQGGETAPELFDVMTASKAESGANFEVVDPVLPGFSPDSVLATVNFTLPDAEPQTAENVEFIQENGQWKLSQSWACTLITNTVTPEQVPAMCSSGTAEPAN
ncbi:MAG: hypothetical protein SOW59_05725 [Corynebacterium sp.]|nr:hypothetical protein [Corynebacterium sp.]